LAQQVRAGGNACNTARVLAQLGVEAHWVGNLSDQPQVRLVHAAFERVGVDYSRAVSIPGGVLPTSYITLSQATGSRSIVHYRDLPEYAAEDFRSLDLAPFDWIHFEGRAIEELIPMLQRTRSVCGIPVSLEVEKPRVGIEALFDQVDVLFFSRDYAVAQGFDSAQALLASLPGCAAATCTWGEHGAWALDFQGDLWHEPAHPPPTLVDTIGAGDVFNAGMLAALSAGVPVAEALRRANRLAGEQCGSEGLELSNA
jgi:ketohexokinase